MNDHHFDQSLSHTLLHPRMPNESTRPLDHRPSPITANGSGTGGNLSANTLATLSKLDKQRYIVSFLKNQRTYRDVFLKEGHAHSQAWTKASAKSAVSGIHDENMTKPHEIERLDTTATPILKARNPNIPTLQQTIRIANTAASKKPLDVECTANAMKTNQESVPQRHKAYAKKPESDADNKDCPVTAVRKRARSDASKDSSVKARMCKPSFHSHHPILIFW
jgi:hypothetical protein